MSADTSIPPDPQVVRRMRETLQDAVVNARRAVAQVSKQMAELATVDPAYSGNRTAERAVTAQRHSYELLCELGGHVGDLNEEPLPGAPR